MATPSVKRKLRSGKVFALPSTVRKPNSDAARHWLENEDCKHIATSFRDVRFRNKFAAACTTISYESS